MTEPDYRAVSFWLDDLGGELRPRPALPNSLDADVCIVGAGFTGLWTAYYLRRSEPDIRIAVLDAEVAGFGASGRNGGWCSALFPVSAARLVAAAGHARAAAMQRALVDTVDEVGRVCAAESIDAHFVKGGTISLARTPVQLRELRSRVTAARELGMTDADLRWLTAAQAADRIAATRVLGASYTPHCASLHPGHLVRGLAEVVEGIGVRIYERTAVRRIEPRVAHADAARVRAEVVVRATEGFTPRLAGLRRALVPVYSLMVVTEPLPAAWWSRVRWDHETLTDGRHLLVYAQRTADDRIAFGGRGAPYHFRSGTDAGYDRDPRVFAALRSALLELFPTLSGVRLTHAWGGPLGVPRDWFPSVALDRGNGLGYAGGYVGDGVAASNLAGRTLRDLILGRETELTTLPWVAHRSRRWEPEPVRWLGINGLLRLNAWADSVEERTGKPSAAGRLAGWLSGA